jgi:hypothetical protein
VRALVILGVSILVLAGCGSGTPRSPQRSATPKLSDQAARCVERFVAAKEPPRLTEARRRTFVEGAYCVPFDEKGWVHADGSLSVAAQQWLVRGGVIGPEIDCVVLHVVRRGEARRYIRRLQRYFPSLRCYDGTPLADLGVPLGS